MSEGLDMELRPDALQKRVKDFRDGLRRAGVKLTHQRLEIFREVAKSGDHPDAETIFTGVRERLPMVSLDTVYRTLWLLIDLGLLTTVGPPKGRARFDANMSSHHHFVCVKCGMTRDFYSQRFDQLKIPDTVKSLGSVQVTQVQVRGICLRCSKKTSPEHRTRGKKERE